MREKVFIYDYFGLAGEDIPAWRETFFWPVPRETTNRIAEDAAAFACGLIEELGETFEGDCLTIGHLVLKDIARVLNHCVGCPASGRGGLPHPDQPADDAGSPADWGRAVAPGPPGHVADGQGGVAHPLGQRSVLVASVQCQKGFA